MVELLIIKGPLCNMYAISLYYVNDKSLAIEKFYGSLDVI